MAITRRRRQRASVRASTHAAIRGRPVILRFSAWRRNVRQPIRILSIDGGGIRGIIPAMVLAELERRTGRPICKLFDLIAGTSTGGVLALALTKPDAAGKPA